jgi:cytochrome c peroxidase
MKKFILIFSSGLFLMIILQNCEKELEPEIKFTKPKNFPEPLYDLSKNPITKEGFELGRSLFYDGILSKDGTISCGFCHQQRNAFTQHGHAVSHGIDDLLTLRNSMPIMNMAWQREFLWIGGIADLDLFAVSPIEAHNEMGETLPNVLEKLRKHAAYPQRFEKAFGTKEITTANFLKALSQFQLMCISADSKYDKFVRNEGVDLSLQEKEGLNIFKQKCATCHTGELFTDLSYRNNGLLGKLNDMGREEITANEVDRFKFKVPSLRNVAVSKPYMHDGRFKELEQVLEHYASQVLDSPTLDPLLKQNGKLGIALSNNEKQKIIAFLHALTDEEFLKDIKLAEQ